MALVAPRQLLWSVPFDGFGGNWLVSDSGSRWVWLERVEKVVGLWTPLAALASVVIGWVGGLIHGETNRSTELLKQIGQIETAMPADSAARTGPLFDVLKSIVAGTPISSEADAASLARRVARAVVEVPVSTFSTKGARTFRLPEARTALACNDRLHLTLEVPRGGGSILQVDGIRTGVRPGSTVPLRDGGRITVMQIDQAGVDLDVQCGATTP